MQLGPALYIHIQGV